MSGFTFQWGWILPAGGLAAVIVLCFAFVLARRGPIKPGSLTTWHIKSNLEYDETYHAYRRYRILSVSSITVCLLALLGALGISARPSSIDIDTDSSATRDIVLCLDVSGSALPFDRQVIAAYKDLVKNFQGERIGLSIFNSTSRAVFPLTDDYSVVDEQLTHALDILVGVQNQESIESMSDADYQQISSWLAGTQNRVDATSLIGDGLMSCAAMLPELTLNKANEQGGSKGDNAVGEQAKHAASIVFATDNVLSGQPLYTLSQALDITTRSAIQVDGLYSGDPSTLDDSTSVDFRNLITAHAGIFSTPYSTPQSDDSKGNDSVAGMVASIEAQHASHEEQPRYNLRDDPAIWVFAFAALFLVDIVLTGRLRR